MEEEKIMVKVERIVGYTTRELGNRRTVDLKRTYSNIKKSLLQSSKHAAILGVTCALRKTAQLKLEGSSGHSAPSIISQCSGCFEKTHVRTHSLLQHGEIYDPSHECLQQRIHSCHFSIPTWTDWKRIHVQSTRKFSWSFTGEYVPYGKSWKGMGGEKRQELAPAKFLG